MCASRTAVKARRKLHSKIILEYGSISEFSKEIDFTHAYILYVINGQSNGSLKFWMKTKKALKLKDSEMWSYQIINV